MPQKKPYFSPAQQAAILLATAIAETLPCPLCQRVFDSTQKLAVDGDDDATLFCPHCMTAWIITARVS